MRSNNEHTTPLKAAKRAYCLFAEQILHNEEAAEEMAMLEESSARERAEFHKHLVVVARRVRKALGVAA